MPKLNREQIKEIIPHRDPFLLIDEIIELEIGIKAKAIKYIKSDDFWFQGHFPNYPVTPGVLMVEMLAQTGAVVMLSKEENKGKLAFFAGIDDVKFKRQVVPGDVLVLETTINKQRGSIGIGTGIATVNGELAVSAEIKFAIQNS
ncbi:3-hydroxyacyl-[acyl-carrier-protein] dehydratase FabZ [Clostridia bacterium]|nr:3-hydroxyacyl-[acyl-carrier-protein] dehydratase FabZ [Clostridia bacterium]